MYQHADHTQRTLESYGWTPVPHDQSVLLQNISPWNPANYNVADIRLPDTELAKKVHQYAKQRLPEEVYNHSMRVYYYGEYHPPPLIGESQLELTWHTGASIAQKHLPSFIPSLETYYLTALLHDIGTTPENLHGTLMSFDFFGGFVAMDVLKDYGAPQAQAESVAEAIIRHQDLGDAGTITTVGQLIQLATLFGT